MNNIEKALYDLKATTNKLVFALQADDLDKAHEAVSVLLTQGLNHFGMDHPAMKQFMPVWSAIESHISEGKIDNALDQSELWNRQLDEVISHVDKAGKRGG